MNSRRAGQWWRFDPAASTHDRVRFHVWRGLALGLLVGVVLWTYAGGLIFAVGYGTLSAGMDEARRKHRARPPR